MSLADLRIYTVVAPRHSWRFFISMLENAGAECDALKDIRTQLQLGVPFHPAAAQTAAFEEQLRIVLEQNELLRTQLADAVATCGGGRTDQIGRSRVKTPQIDVRRIKRWRDALILTDR